MHTILLARRAATAILTTLAAGAIPDPAMRPVEEYLMARDAEIALARSAAPNAISHDATILVLSRRGYETAVQGTNGFVCFVERGWIGPFDLPEMWNPRIRGPDCLNPEAARSVLPVIEKKTALYLAGRSRPEVIAAVKTALANRELPGRLEPGAMSYMMSRSAYLYDDGDHNGSHLMFYTPIVHAEDWGTGVEHSPVVASVSYWFMSNNAESVNFPPIRVFAVPLATWSDGSPAHQ
jgi:hypothetical protein